MLLGVLAVLDRLVPNNSLTWGCVPMHPPEDPFLPMSSLGLGLWELLSPSRSPTTLQSTVLLGRPFGFALSAGP